ncbi:MAG: hypothetical protein MJ189_03205 [Coriobacteriales bacterium]|nr:hypothetical protein [Coriobacteriales bacterium]
MSNAKEIFLQCKDSKAEYWGFKEVGLPKEEMIELFGLMKEANKKTVLEIVCYTEKESLEGIQTAIDCNCDYVMGTIFTDKINDLCKKHNLLYMPFVGEITGRPSILNGEIDDMLKEAQSYIDKGVYGIDLLGYRYTKDAFLLNKTLASKLDAPLCIAGSIDSYKRLDEIKEISPWAFTIGGAFFENKFNGSFKEQIDKVCNYIND